MKQFLIWSSVHIALIANSAPEPSYYMQNRLPTQNGRYKTFHEALRLLEEHTVNVLVETGTARCGDTNFDGDGGSTILFGHWAYEHGAQLYSVDNNEKHVTKARKAVEPYESAITFVIADSVEFLHQFTKPIDFLYLDSLDYDVNDPPLAQLHCLREIQAAYDKLSDTSIIMIDDCNIPGGGKGKLAIQWLKERGWHLHRNKHQVILLKKAR